MQGSWRYALIVVLHPNYSSSRVSMFTKTTVEGSMHPTVNDLVRHAMRQMRRSDHSFIEFVTTLKKRRNETDQQFSERVDNLCKKYSPE